MPPLCFDVSSILLLEGSEIISGDYQLIEAPEKPGAFLLLSSTVEIQSDRVYLKARIDIDSQ
jgi:hypothetical protein